MSGSVRYGKGSAARLVDDDDPLPIKSLPSPRKLMDYDVRTDSNPVYVGTAPQSALVGDDAWIVQKLFYDGSDRVVDVQVLTGAWTGRASFAWKASGGD